MGEVITFTLGVFVGGVLGWLISFTWDYFDLKNLRKELKEKNDKPNN